MLGTGGMAACAKRMFLAVLTTVRPSGPRGKFIAENKLRVVYGCQLVPYGTSGLERVNNETHA